jgi:hypothetical protein
MVPPDIIHESSENHCSDESIDATGSTPLCGSRYMRSHEESTLLAMELLDNRLSAAPLVEPLARIVARGGQFVVGALGLVVAGGGSTRFALSSSSSVKTSASPARRRRAMAFLSRFISFVVATCEGR